MGWGGVGWGLQGPGRRQTSLPAGPGPRKGLLSPRRSGGLCLLLGSGEQQQSRSRCPQSRETQPRSLVPRVEKVGGNQTEGGCSCQSLGIVHKLQKVLVPLEKTGGTGFPSSEPTSNLSVLLDLGSAGRLPRHCGILAVSKTIAAENFWVGCKMNRGFQRFIEPQACLEQRGWGFTKHPHLVWEEYADVNLRRGHRVFVTS
ncbi:uncharacterized protein LOC134478667 [Cavia porcellus]|uniref:uncharacterized protein LOC134478667 n=1 Tax=Cavia porcellus TaxID=10141 RepID=UPI002FE0B113